MDSSAATSTDHSVSKPRGRGRGRSRGGLGKYLRARGRGRGGGRPAEFRERLVLAGERPEELDEEEAEELQKRYSRRQLGSNADRYAEPEPELGSDGEEILEPEVDLSRFLERQRLDDAPPPLGTSVTTEEHEDDVDHTLSHVTAKPVVGAPSRKGKVQHIEWDSDLEQMSREKVVAEANWELKTRFRAKTAQKLERAGLRDTSYVEAPPLPIESKKPPQDAKSQMEDFLDDLLS
ncbi:hypothetical protein HETIRDRAFT_322371 [Heterobasidion irregulare TC 32-1]|uniref:Uncharacterized protein n=1 Tax=Heterobasidion irregulare (strain TC 32-1) TaxID=747525 RepID=W4K3R5_HETIT|nr:uncharacterized protein HETIRDRAFT_322371 [Heterobasidion irregulare TC 32-1]ETW79711.1 hypothetical protein HETIRDRAFT_322371 [Heterobasidion irregulare TC 32-1]